MVVDSVYRRTGSQFLSRSGAAICGMSISGLSFLAAIWVRDPVWVVIVISAGALFSSLGNPATWAAAMDLGGRYTPIVVGVMNMAGTMGAYFCPKQVGVLFDYIHATGGTRWDLVLLLFAGVNLATALLWVFVNPRRSLDEA